MLFYRKVNMENFLENLLKKPEGYRKSVALLASFVFTLLVFSFWLLDLRSDLARARNEENKNYISPLASIKDGFANVFEASFVGLDSVKQKFDDLFVETVILDDVNLDTGE